MSFTLPLSGGDTQIWWPTGIVKPFTSYEKMVCLKQGRNQVKFQNVRIRETGKGGPQDRALSGCDQNRARWVGCANCDLLTRSSTEKRLRKLLPGQFSPCASWSWSAVWVEASLSRSGPAAPCHGQSRSSLHDTALRRWLSALQRLRSEEKKQKKTSKLKKHVETELEKEFIKRFLRKKKEFLSHLKCLVLG